MTVDPAAAWHCGATGKQPAEQPEASQPPRPPNRENLKKPGKNTCQTEHKKHYRTLFRRILVSLEPALNRKKYGLAKTPRVSRL
jgi:hypothetical protein